MGSPVHFCWSLPKRRRPGERESPWPTPTRRRRRGSSGELLRQETSLRISLSEWTSRPPRVLFLIFPTNLPREFGTACRSCRGCLFSFPASPRSISFITTSSRQQDHILGSLSLERSNQPLDSSDGLRQHNRATEYSVGWYRRLQHQRRRHLEQHNHRQWSRRHRPVGHYA